MDDAENINIIIHLLTNRHQKIQPLTVTIQVYYGIISPITALHRHHSIEIPSALNDALTLWTTHKEEKRRRERRKKRRREKRGRKKKEREKKRKKGRFFLLNARPCTKDSLARGGVAVGDDGCYQFCDAVFEF